jgi:RNA polymerase primary sigma factor
MPESTSYYRFLNSMKVRALTTEQERALSDRIKAGDESAAGELVQANMRFAVNRSKRFLGKGVEMDDLVSGALLGMMRAAQKFDADRGFRFISYARLYADQGCQKEIIKVGASVTLPASVTAGTAAIADFYARPGNLPGGLRGNRQGVFQGFIRH